MDEVIKQLKELNQRLANLEKQVNDITIIQSLQNDSLIYISHHLNDDTNVMNKLTTINAKLNDNDLKVSSIEDMMEEVKTQLDTIPEHFQSIYDMLNTIYYDKGKNTNPYGGLILS